MSARFTKILVLAALALGVAASSGTAALPAHRPFLGVVPHAGGHATSLFGNLTTIGSGPVAYHGGGVMPTNTTYAIYWVPGGYSVSAQYESLIDRYFQDVAAAGGSASNVYSAATQYYDSTASIRYASTFGGAYVDTHAFPASGCNDGVSAVCLTDEQLRSEIQRVIGVKGWHEGGTSMVFLLTPDGVASCFDAFGNQCSTNTYCAYHSDFVDPSNGQFVIYADEPYAGTQSGCTYSLNGQQGFPNGHDADAEINTISHEHNEAITDPFGDAWYANDTNGDETGDLCAGNFGATPLGTANGQPYDQLINGHPYSIQQEYSNDDGDCVSGYTPSAVPSTVEAPGVSGKAGQSQLLSTSVGAWMHAPSGYAYRWQRCSAGGSSCADIAGASAATYRLAAADVGHKVRAEVSAQNVVGASVYVASSATAVVVPLPSSAAAPAVSGLAAVGKKLSTTAGTWNTQATFAYAWLRCTANGSGCATIAGATSATYVAVAADAGHTLEARVTATNAAGSSTALSNPSSAVVGAPAVLKAPHISGRARVGRRLSASHGLWTYSPTSYRYQWLRCNAHGGSCSRIRRATNPRYRLTKRDARHRLRMRVTAVNAAGSGSSSSATTAVVKR